MRAAAANANGPTKICGMSLRHPPSKSFLRAIRGKSALPVRMGYCLRSRDFSTRTICALIQSRRNRLAVAISEQVYRATPKKRHACVCHRVQKAENQNTPVRLHAQLCRRSRPGLIALEKRKQLPLRSFYFLSCGLVIAGDKLRRSGFAHQSRAAFPRVPICFGSAVSEPCRVTVNSFESNAHDVCPVSPARRPNHFSNLAPVLLQSQSRSALVD